MKPSVWILLGSLSFMLAGCQRLPKECDNYWNSIEKISKQMQMSELQIKTRKQQFEEQVTAMNKQEATEYCSRQSAFLNLMKE
jgi:starvation-inducible outer membrane lipoprotein